MRDYYLGFSMASHWYFKNNEQTFNPVRNVVKITAIIVFEQNLNRL